MTVVLDTNVLAVIISRRSRYYPIWQSLRQGGFQVLVTSDILLEYDEILSGYLGPEVTQNVLGGLELLPARDQPPTPSKSLARYYLWE